MEASSVAVVETRLAAISAAVARWEEADSLDEARAAAEESRNLITGLDTMGAGDLDGDGTVSGAVDDGLLPDEQGGPGLASALSACPEVDRDVLGGSWDDPAGRWQILSEAIEAWSPTNNPFPGLPSHPQRVVGWATLALDGTSLEEAREFAGHARLHVTVTEEALADCEVASGDERWKPTVGASWQWQLSDLPVDLSVEADVFDVDLFETDADTVADIHAGGAKAICYVSVGTWEPGRPDADRFPENALGETLDDFPDERWLDIGDIAVLAPLMEARLDLCASKGFDAVEPDNADGYSNNSGFALTAEDQLAFNTWVARAVHDRGLAVGLKNDLDQIDELVDEFDFAVNEQCVQYDECRAVERFVDAGKPVFHAEYEVSVEEMCEVATPLGLSSTLKGVDLDAAYEWCD